MISLSLPTSLPVSKKVHRWAVSTLFFLQGLCFASWASRIPTIQQTLGLNESQLGAVLLAIPVGSMISLPVSGWLVAKFGSKKVVTLGVFLYSLTLITLGMAQNTFQLISYLLLFGFGGNFLNIGVNTQAVGVEAMYKKPIMGMFHGMWSLAGFSGAAIGTLMIGAGIVPVQHFLAVTIFVILAALISTRFTIAEDPNRQADQPIFAKPDKSLLMLGVIAFCSMICEGAMFDWSGVYFKKVVQADAAWVGAGYTAFMATMASGRFVADWFTGKFGLKRTLQLSGILIAIGLLLAVLLPNLITAMAGFLLVGAGVSSVIPLVYSAAGKSKVLSPGVALAAVSTIGFLGFLMGPPLIGLVAGATSLRVSFFIIAIMGLCVSVFSTRAKLA
ncbi:MFS transporter [Adhaeribacter arboris]|uniref:MFS transporter n=1 Tax=Adhaeribacter arboris TaxID=2072846 RepID=A0A2T2YGN9_9BACT|nr:MFS transporter [Adhaeribacter arboris]PSR54675.1 MFS transporter [Adhaeribacter arboris]